MIRRSLFGWFCLAGSLLVLASANAACAQQPLMTENPLVITLLPTVSVDDRVVYLDQIAKITGGTGQARMRTGRLDVAVFAIFDDEAIITAEQVRFRMALAGLAARDVRIEGSPRVVVTESRRPLSSRHILAHAYIELMRRLGTEAATVAIEVNHDIVVPQIKVRDTDKVTYHARLSTPPKRSGKTRVDVAIAVNGTMREIIPLLLETSPLQSVAVLESQPATPIRLTSGNLSLPAPREPGPEMLVRNRDRVRLMVHIANTKIETPAEALEDGTLGAFIRVRNLTTNETRSARIEGAGIVVIRLD